MKTILAILAAGLVWAAGPVAAQETRVGEEGFESPPATIADAVWLVGQWSGDGIGGAEAHESWLAASGDTMVGTFVQETDDGTIMFTEHMYLMELDGSLVVKLKHFNPDMTGWEDKEGMVTFRLLSAEQCALFFNALTYRCVDPQVGPGSGLVVAVRMKSDKPEPQELVFQFDRLTEARAAPSACQSAVTTPEVNQCYSTLYEQAEERRGRYLDAARKKYGDRAEMLAMIDQADEAFVTYRDGECRAVHADYGYGTIRTVMMLACLIERTDARTRTIWQNWLTYDDSTTADLPEPKPTL